MMSKIKRAFRDFLNFKLGVSIYRLLPLGIDPIYDIRRKLKGYEIKTVFDIGANKGETLDFFLKRIPSARFFAFEPVSTTFDIISKKFTGQSNVQIFNIAIGNQDGETHILPDVESDLSSIVNEVDVSQNAIFQKIEMKKIDTLTKQLKLEHIDFLKIDTEGYDLEVLKSATQLLKGGKIDFIQVEAGLNPYNRDHVRLEEFISFLNTFDYFLFGFYEQKHDWKNKKLILRRCDPVFVSAALLRKYSLF